MENASERVAFYRLASRVIDTWFADRSDGSECLSRQATGETVSRLSYQWMPRVLARLLGLQG